MKKILALTVFLFSININAQDADKAKDLLDKVSAKVKSYKNIQIKFKYSLNNSKENINQDSKGTAVLQGNQYVLNFMNVTKMCDGKKIYTISKEDEEVTIAPVGKNEEDNDTPEKMLTFFDKGFKYAWDISQKVKGKKIQYIKLIPLNTKDERKQILVGIDTKTMQVYNTITTNKKGTVTTLTVNSFKTNSVLPKNQFIFVKSKYPNYYINNLD